MQTPKHILEQIQVNQAERNPVLDLRWQNIREIPEEIRELSHLEQLLLDFNQIKTLPVWLEQLQNLTSLSLIRNGLNTLPPEIWQLQTLTSLNLSNNDLNILPQEIGKLQTLTSLILNYNKIKILPPEIGELHKLALLSLIDNKIYELPPEIGQLQNLVKLDIGNDFYFSGNKLSELPSEIGNLRNLTELNLKGNQINTLPTEIGQLKKLTTLNLWGNRLETLPAEIGQLQSLYVLLLRGNLLHTLPPEIGELKKLSRLSLGVNKISTLPPEIGGLQGLTVLNLWDNKISALPSEIGKLKKLSKLSLMNNQLSVLPREIIKLQKISVLNLQKNCFSIFPQEVTHLKNLVELNIGWNRIHSLPSEICQLKKLITLKINTNYLKNPSPVNLSINKNKEIDVPKLRAYFRDLVEQGVEPIYEAKLLIIGEGGAGKTTLAWRLMDEQIPMPDESQSTEGIDVWQWDVDCPLNGGGQHSVRLNIWDFGGQDIYHATHQFFLSHNALYVLVANTRRNDTDFYWWLSIVEKLGGESPVLLLKNEMDDRVFSLDEGSLRKRFGKNLKEIMAGNLATKRGLDVIKDEIIHRVRSLKHIGEKYPRLWKRVREKLEAHPQPYISWGEYEQVCLDTGLQRDSAGALISLLHNLGVCLHFAEVPLLRKTVILKPTWATEAVYRVLDDREVQTQAGRFTLEDVQRIWQTPKKVRECRFAECLQQHEWQPKDFAQMHHELLAMMEKFELCYPLPQKDEYIAPSLLEKTAKTYDFPDGGLLIVYDYSAFMPSGLVGHLLARRHEWIEEQRTLAWRYGAVLRYGSTRAEVIEDRERRELRLRLVGNGCRDMATLLMDELDTIHGRFKGLEFDIFIPCQCQRPEQAKLKLKKVLKACNLHQPLQCDECFEALNATQILNGVMTPERLEEAKREAGAQFDQQRQHADTQYNAENINIYQAGFAPAPAPAPESKPTQAQAAANASPRAEALAKLKGLSDAQFQELVFVYEAPDDYLPSAAHPKVSQAIALLKYAQQRDGGFAALLAVLAGILG